MEGKRGGKKKKKERKEAHISTEEVLRKEWSYGTDGRDQRKDSSTHMHTHELQESESQGL